MKSASLALLRVVLAWLLVLAPSVGLAKPSKKVDRQVRKVCIRAEKMLDALEYERARALLESSVRKKRNARAKPSTKARLWALLGRARAELGDTVGSDEAFIEAVRWDRRVRLGKRTSPKIREALERARDLAPPPAGRAPEPPPEPPPSEPPPQTAPPPREPPPQAAPPPRADRPKPPPRTRRRRRRPPPPPKAPPPAPAVNESASPARKGRWVDFGIKGERSPGATVQIVASYGGLPRRAKLEARVRRSQAGPFEKLRLTRSGTVAVSPLVLDSPRLEVFVVAKRGRKTLASAGSEAAPRVITPASTAPSLAEAWSNNPPPPAAPPPPLPPPESAGTSSIATAPPPPITDPGPGEPTAFTTSQLTSTEITLLAVGGAVVVASVVTAILLLTTSSSNCDVNEGQGCVEIQVVPSSLLRF